MADRVVPLIAQVTGQLLCESPLPQGRTTTKLSPWRIRNSNELPNHRQRLYNIRMSGQGKWGLGIGAAVVLVVVILVLSHRHPPSHSCDVPAAGLGVVASDIAHQDSWKFIVGTGTAIAATVACEDAVNTFEGEPSQPVPVKIGGVPQTITGNQLQSSDFIRDLQCDIRYKGNTSSIAACQNGDLAP